MTTQIRRPLWRVSSRGVHCWNLQVNVQLCFIFPCPLSFVRSSFIGLYPCENDSEKKKIPESQYTSFITANPPVKYTLLRLIPGYTPLIDSLIVAGAGYFHSVISRQANHSFFIINRTWTHSHNEKFTTPEVFSDPVNILVDCKAGHVTRKFFISFQCNERLHTITVRILNFNSQTISYPYPCAMQVSFADRFYAFKWNQTQSHRQKK